MKRTAIFIYGLAVYVVFLAVFCYLMGFVAGLFVPRHIDGPGDASANTLLAVAINVGFLALFAVQHAIMARPAFKRWWTQFIPQSAERSTFVLATVSILTAMVLFWQPLPGIVWKVTHPAGQGVLWTLYVIGWATVLYSTFLIDHFDLFGLRQVWLQFRNRPYTQKQFMERSLYKWVRHPLMVGFLIAFWATPTMTVGHLLFAVVTTGYILIGTQIEERDLIDLHGDDYLDYARRTRAFVPSFGRKKSKDRENGLMTM